MIADTLGFPLLEGIKGKKSFFIKSRSSLFNIARLKCVKCGNVTRVLYKRDKEEENVTLRKRKCSACNYDFLSIEILFFSDKLTVCKKNGKREKFDIKKLQTSIMQTFTKENRLSQNDIDSIIFAVREKLKYHKNVSTLHIHALVAEQLRKYNELLYLRYILASSSVTNSKDLIYLIDKNR